MALGQALRAAGDPAGAMAAWRRAAVLDPAQPGAWAGPGLLIHAAGGDAAAAFGRAGLITDLAAAWFNLGLAHARFERWAEALPAFAAARARAPDHPAAGVQEAGALQALGRTAEAAALLRAAWTRAGDPAQALNNLGNALIDLNQRRPAAAVFAAACALAPAEGAIWANRGLAALALGDPAARAWLDRARVLAPADPVARWHRTMAELPLVYDRDEDIAAARAGYDRALAELDAWLAAAPAAVRAEAARAVGASQPFFLAYQGRCDRDLQARYGRLVRRVSAARYPGFADPPPAPAAGPLRVGLVSGFFRRHSVWKYPLRGWLAALAGHFEVFGYHTGGISDDQTELARTWCDHWRAGPRPVADWARRIRDDRLDVLIHPELGMDVTSVRLAALNLAPVQAQGWAHPTSGGLPTIAYYLTCDAMEPVDGPAHYNETLVPLPQLATAYRPVNPPAAPVDRAELGLAPGDVAFWCCQSLFKYLPGDDHLFADIAAGLDTARFVFIRHAGGDPTARFQARLGRAFAARGLDAGRHCRFVDPLPAARFEGVTAVMDLFLDNPAWSGNNTAFEALAHGVPVLTLPGGLMRQRHAAATLAALGVTDTIAQSRDDLVALAVALGGDAAARAALGQRIRAALPRLYDSPAPGRALRHFVRAVARRTP